MVSRRSQNDLLNQRAYADPTLVELVETMVTTPRTVTTSSGRRRATLVDGPG
jgi:hypothetical protein